MSILKRCNIPGPEPNVITGNLFTFFAKKNIENFSEYIQTYGKTCGYYIGKKPIILTIDTELIKRIQIKDFDKFPDRDQPSIKYGLHPNPKYFNHLISVRGGKWKAFRSILNPTFSALKLKNMTPIMESAIDIFIGKIDEQAKKGNEFDIYDNYQLLTADVISKAALGIDTNVQNDPKNRFFEAAKAIFDFKTSKLMNRILLLFLCFPELDFFLYPVRRFIEIIREVSGNSNNVIVGEMVTAAIDLRNKKKEKTSDLLQLMLDAKISEKDIKSKNFQHLEMSEVDETDNSVKIGVSKNMKKLTEEEIRMNAIVFYEAGYETTSSTLGFVTHFLVNYQDVQEKLRDEINDLWAKEGVFNYNTVNKLTYMQCVINEAMRFYPAITAFITRYVDEDYHYKDIVIPKGATVRIPTHQLHHCEEYWPKHDVFDPERFRDKTSYDPMTFQAFGHGPRNCIGMRFALYEMKLTLAKLLFKYRLVPGLSLIHI